MNKYDYEAKINREKRENERRKNLLILILRYLINLGYSETAFKLQEEASLDLDKFDAADNIDLYIILCDYEEFFELRFNKKPKLVTKINENEISSRLPNIKGKDFKTFGNVDKSVKNGSNKQSQLAQTHSKNNNTKKPDSAMNINKKEENDIKLELVGQSVIPINKSNKENKEAFSFNDQKESILLKPIPDNFFGNNEMKELAGLVRR